MCGNLTLHSHSIYSINKNRKQIWILWCFKVVCYVFPILRIERPQHMPQMYALHVCASAYNCYSWVYLRLTCVLYSKIVKFVGYFRCCCCCCRLSLCECLCIPSLSSFLFLIWLFFFYFRLDILVSWKCILAF